ncbi:hypothetical protein GCM10007860_11930 [Chitiniphilus shinanonensis]|uniref:TPR repeat-containing protein n=1 Tax=Chitiniphilus shinanonensis TaxID=553088 RepID=A0ABQ6BRH6_9NEIS|nr:tetratricopeptide repeat protein [Chitiniphilus shinanonensis]GLS04047.1 hypothetical protein GCM10007860_11930 [Chitiniphilus shinanonensis]
MTQFADHFSSAQTYHQQGQLELALANYQEALLLDNDNSEVLYLIGTCKLQQGKLSEAVHFLEKSILISPNNYHALINLGLIFYEQNLFFQAAEKFQKALEIGEHTPSLYVQMGLALFGCGEYKSANEHFQIANDFGNNEPLLYTTWISSLLVQFRNIEAFDVAERWAKVDSSHANQAQAQQLIALSKARLPQATDLKTGNREFLDNHLAYEAWCAQYENDMPEAIRLYERHLLNCPADARAHFSHAVCLFQEGHYAKAWEEFEWRNKEGGVAKTIFANFPQWTGIEPGMVLVHSEQGAGDVLQFMRFFPLMQQRGAKVVFASYNEILELLRQNDQSETIEDSDLELNFDYQISLLSLGKIFCSNAIDIAANQQYVFANTQKSQEWKNRLSRYSGLKVGLVWAGNRRHVNDVNRSMSLAQWSFLAEIRGLDLFSLQKGGAEQEIACLPPWFHINDLGPEISDFGDTAAILENLDLLITVDTSVAHLAGAMHKPVWVFLPANSDWRWELKNNSTPWYPTMKLFRQDIESGWQQAFSEIRTLLGTQVTTLDFASLDDIDSNGAKHSKANRRLACHAIAQKMKGKLEDLPNDFKSSLEKFYPDLNIYIEAILGKSHEIAVAALEGNDLYIRAASHALIASEYPLDPTAEKLLDQFQNNDVPILGKLLGLIANHHSRFEESLAHFTTYLRSSPRDLEALMLAGKAAVNLRKINFGIELIQYACTYHPDSASAWHMLGWALQQRHSWRASTIALQTALRLQADNPIDVNSLLCQAYLALGEFDDAEELINKLSGDWPDSLELMWMKIRKANVLGQHEFALQVLEQARKKNLTNSQIVLSESMVRLALNNSHAAWHQYESRLSSPIADTLDRFFPNHGIPKWGGEELGKKRLLVFAEQGLGDTLHFMHYYLPLRDRVVWIAPDKLVNYLRDYFPHVLPKSEAKINLPQADCYCESMSFPALTGITDLEFNLFKEIDAHKPKRAFPEIDKILSRANGRPKVGMVWAGNPAHVNDYWRSCNISYFKDLLSRNDMAVFSLQKDEASNQILSLARHLWPENLAVALDDMTSTAYALSKLDILISVDTAIAHLAGSLGVPTILLLGAANDWRWGVREAPRKIYPSVYPIFQEKINDWSSSVEQAITLLEDLINRP